MKKLIGICIIVIALIFGGCNINKADVSGNEVEQTSKKTYMKLKIMTTNKMLYYMVKDISGERHLVEYMFNNYNEIWKFNFTKDSLENISRKDLFIYIGADYEPWCSSFVNNLSKTTIGVINASRGVRLLSYNQPIAYKNTTCDNNPYYWLNIDNYKIALLNVKNAIEEKDPENRDIYENNFKKSVEVLDKYDKKFEEVCPKLKDYTFVSYGDALGYFFKYNDLNYIELNRSLKPKDIISTSEENENKLKNKSKLIFLYTSNKDLKENADIIKKYHMKFISMSLGKDNLKYIDVLNYNLNSLKSIDDK